MYRLQIRDEKSKWVDLDLTGDEVIAMTYESKNIGDIASNYGWSTTTFNLPGTIKNQRLLGFPDYINTGYVNAWRKNPCRLFAGGSDITHGGAYLQINKTTREGDLTLINCIIYSGIQDFAERLKSKKLRDLPDDLPGLADPYFDVNGVLRSYSYGEEELNDPEVIRTATIPVADWTINFPKYITNNETKTEPKVDVRGLQPAVRIRDVVNGICKHAGFTLSTDLDDEPFEESIFKNLAMSVVDDNIIIPDNEKDFYNAEYVHSGGSVNFNTITTGSHYNFKTQDISGNFISNGNNLIYKKFEYPGKYFFDVKVNVSVLQPAMGLADMSLKVKFNQETEEEYIVSHGKPGSYNVIMTIPFEYEASPDDSLSFEFTVRIGTVLIPPNPYIHINSVEVKCTAFEPAEKGRIPVGKLFPVVPNLPDITQWEMFKEFLNFFGLSCRVDYFENIVYANTFQYIDGLSRKGQARDWTNKLDMRTEETEFDLDYAQENILKYKEYEYTDANDKEHKVTDEWSFKVGTFENPEDESTFRIYDTLSFTPKTMYEFKAGACLTSQFAGFPPDLAHIPWIKDGKPEGNAPFVFMLLNKFENNITIKFVDATFPDQSKKEFISSSFNEIKTQEILNKYYTVLINKILRYPRKITVNMKLNLNDVKDFNHFIPVYLKQYGTFFYINKIDKFRPDRLTKVELIKI